MRCIGIIGAMEVEVASLKEQMKDIQVTRKASMEFYSGIIEGKNVVVVRSGIGKVNAAVCTQILIDDFKAEVVINTGIAGSLNADINIGDIVVSTDLIHHDMNAVAFGYPVGQIPQMEAFSFHSDDALRALAVKACKEAVLMEIGTLRLQFVKCSCRTQSAASSYCKFTYKNWQAKQNEKDKIYQINKNKCGASVLTAYIREFPYVSKPYGTSCGNQNKTKS